jgi:pyrimidine operon attenuation protein/uracil phosphoribosyltransferase
VTSIVIAMVVVLAIVAGTIGTVLVGIEGRGKFRAPRLADKLAKAAQHLNGDGRPPRTFTRILH